ncbi:MAG: peroxiredoxin [Rhodospirillaceae bacterium]|nr:peroxiredoxin [Rhodospirillaceae bacterium]
MKRFLIGALMSGAVMMPAYAALTKGESAPGFTAQASLAGKEFTFSLDAALKKGPVVLYFYPAAYTRGCNIEAKTFADNADKFAAAGTTIIGVSQDNIKKLNDYSADPEYCAGKFPVAADAGGKITASYKLSTMTLDRKVTDTRGADVTHSLTERTTFVITPDRKVIATLSSNDDKVAPHEHAEKSLEIVQGLKK